MIFSKNNAIVYGQDFGYTTGVPSGIDFKIGKLGKNRIELTAKGYGELKGKYGNGSLYISLKDYEDERKFQEEIIKNETK